jgi:hypothetical protein
MTAEWQAAMEALILVVTLGGPTMHAHVGMLRALNRDVERVFNPDRKDPHWGKEEAEKDEQPRYPRHDSRSTAGAGLASEGFGGRRPPRKTNPEGWQVARNETWALRLSPWRENGFYADEIETSVGRASDQKR